MTTMTYVTISKALSRRLMFGMKPVPLLLGGAGAGLAVMGNRRMDLPLSPLAREALLLAASLASNAFYTNDALTGSSASLAGSLADSFGDYLGSLVR